MTAPAYSLASESRKSHTVLNSLPVSSGTVEKSVNAFQLSSVSVPKKATLLVCQFFVWRMDRETIGSNDGEICANGRPSRTSGSWL